MKVGVNINFSVNKGILLLVVFEYGCLDIVKYLIRKGVDLNLNNEI